MTAIMVAQIATTTGQVTLNLNNHSIADSQTIVPSTCGITFSSIGQVGFTGNAAPPTPDLDEWVKSQPGFNKGALYQVAYTVLVSGSGPTSGASIGTYQSLASNRAWALNVGGGGAAVGVWRFRVREIANTSNFVEADMSMSAFSAPI